MTNPTPYRPQNSFIVALLSVLMMPVALVFAQQAQPPQFSHESGLYRDNIPLTITHPDPSAVIYVSLGAELPNPVAENVYNAPIVIGDRSGEPNYWSTIPANNTDGSFLGFLPPQSTVPKATVVRALAVDGDGNTSEVVTKTYWIHADESFQFYTPVISVVATHDDFFSDERGIYVPGVHGDATNIREGNFAMRGEEWEREGVFTMIDSTGAHIHTQTVGYRTHGGWSRYFPSKSLRIYARNAYEDRIIPIELFEGKGVQPYRRFLLRASGNDQGLSLIRDPLAQELVGHLSFDTQGYQPAVVYINGEYWGIKNIRDRYTRHFLERVHGVDPDEVSILEKDAEVKDGTNVHYLEMMEFAVNMDLSVEEYFAWMESRMDMQNFIEYAAAQVVLANNDWPHNNIDFWRYSGTPGNGVRDGRWRWLMFDIDRSFGLGSNVTTDMVAWLMAEQNHLGEIWPNQLFRNLIEHQGFRSDFINTVMDLLNTVFQPDYVIPVLDSLAAVIEPEMPRHIQRWQRPVSTVAWHNTLFAMRNYARQRPSRVLDHLGRNLDTGEIQQLHVYSDASSGGQAKVNFTLLDGTRPGIGTDAGWWNGSYFDNVPVRLHAMPLPGYRFDHWIQVDDAGSDTTTYFEPQIQIVPDSGQRYKAIFTEDEEFKFDAAPVQLQNETYVMDFWPEVSDDLHENEALHFVYMNQTDPLITAEIAGIADGDFNHDSRTRVTSLGEDGIAFINTSNLDGNPGFPGRRLGGAVLPIDTRGKSSVAIDWTAGTVYPNSRIYNLRLQYRLNGEGEFLDVLDAFGDPVQYNRNPSAGHREVIPTGYLPSEALGHPYVELFWRYYHTGEQVDPESGQRSKLAIHAIKVHSGSSSVSNGELPSTIQLQAFPNPFNAQTTVEVHTELPGDVQLHVFDMMGRRIHTLYEGHLQAGVRSFTWDAATAASGVYMIVAESGDSVSQVLVTLMK
jgi:hypothetical protein